MITGKPFIFAVISFVFAGLFLAVAAVSIMTLPTGINYYMAGLLLVLIWCGFWLILIGEKFINVY